MGKDRNNLKESGISQKYSLGKISDINKGDLVISGSRNGGKAWYRENEKENATITILKKKWYL